MKPIVPIHKVNRVATENLEKLREFVRENIKMKDDVASIGVTEKSFVGDNVVLVGEADGKNEEDLNQNCLLVNVDQEHENRTSGYVPSTCFGYIDFEETTTKDLPRFLRCAEDTKRDTLIELFTNYWDVEAPGVLISFTGGKDTLKLETEIRRDFLEGFSTISTKLRAWVISNGINSGVTELVGEAFYGTDNVCVGIAPWEKIANRNNLIPKEKEQIGEIFSYPIDSPIILEESIVLDSNHSHFLLVDGDTDSVRKEFERYIAPGGRRVPGILLVIEGRDMDTVKRVFRAAWEDRTPCVLFKGSGGISDLLVFACTHVDEIEDSKKRGEVHQGLLSEAERLFPQDKEGHWMKLACEISKFRELFVVADVAGGVDVQCAILHALLKSTNSMYEKMKFAILWNVSEFAQNELVSSKEQWRLGTNDVRKDLQGLLIMALALGRVGFVKLLNKLGVSIKSVLTKNVLGFLYAYRLNMEHSTVHNHNIYTKSVEDTTEFEKHSDVIRTLLRYKHKSKNENEKTEIKIVKCKDIDYLIDKLIKVPPRRFHPISKKHKISEDDPQTYQYPFHQLFIWAILNNMLNMSLMLWEFQDDAILHALFAAQLCQEMLRVARDNYTATDTLELMGRCQATYQDLSLDLMHECYKTNELSTKPLIAKPIDASLVLNGSTGNGSSERRLYEIFQGHSCLSRAVASKDRNFAEAFVAHQAVQDVLDDVWYGSIARKTITGYEILIYIFLPFLLYRENIRSKLNTRLMRCVGNSVVAAERPLPLLNKIFYFYFHAPVVRFYLHAFGYLLFLLLFAYIAMLKKTSTTPGALELLLIVTVFGYAANEVAQIVLRDEPSLHSRIKGYCTNIWNIFDSICILLFIVALILRCHESTLQVGHLLYALDVSLWILRSLNILYIHQKIGPWVLMVGDMLRDLFYFFSILLVFLLSYGIAAKAILSPTQDDIQMFVGPIFKPYFHIMGEYFLDTPENKNTTWFGTPVHNSFAEPIALVLLGIYLLVANVLLLNLVIAIFNSTYEKILGSAVTLWRYHKYEIVLEYAYRRSVLISPLSLLVHLCWFVAWLVCGILCKLLSWCCCPRKKELYTDIAKGFAHVNKEKLQELREMEGTALISLVRRRQVTKKSGD